MFHQNEINDGADAFPNRAGGQMRANHIGSAVPRKHRVVVVGAGFAGLAAVKGLPEGPEFAITLVDRRNHHLFQALLYQVASAGLNPSES